MPPAVPRRIVEFIDTSILTEIVDVPGEAQRHADVIEQLRQRVDDRRQLILPTAAVIETGNHIHHVPDGNARRRCAETFAGMLEDSEPPRRVRRLSSLRLQRALGSGGERSERPQPRLA